MRERSDLFGYDFDGEEGNWSQNFSRSKLDSVIILGWSVLLKLSSMLLKLWSPPKNSFLIGGGLTALANCFFRVGCQSSGQSRVSWFLERLSSFRLTRERIGTGNWPSWLDDKSKSVRLVNSPNVDGRPVSWLQWRSQFVKASKPPNSSSSSMSSLRDMLRWIKSTVSYHATPLVTLSSSSKENLRSTFSDCLGSDVFEGRLDG